MHVEKPHGYAMDASYVPRWRMCRDPCGAWSPLPATWHLTRPGCRGTDGICYHMDSGRLRLGVLAHVLRRVGLSQPRDIGWTTSGATAPNRGGTMKLIGVDVGGTFTDIVCTDTETGRTIIHKVPTTPDDPSHGVIMGVGELCERFGLARGEIDHVLHGTTIATNAILEYNGAVTGMVTTEGYRDILHIGRHQRPQHYSIMQEIPWQDRPLVRRRHRKTVPERLIPPRGEVLIPLDEAAVRQAARELKAAGVQSIAVCFLFSYLNPR